MKKIILVMSLAALLLSCGTEGDKGVISVSGTGHVVASPDTASLRISVTERAETTKEAQNLSNQKLQTIISALKTAGMEERNIRTSALSFANDQVWNPDTRRNEIVGRIVSQSVSVKFEELDESPALLPSVLDELGRIDGIGIGELLFSIDDPQPQYKEARRLAFEKAEQKARELASYAGIELGKALEITENSLVPGPYVSNAMVQRNEISMDFAGAAPSEIPGGEIAITYEVNVLFETRH